ncbi:kinesin-like protein KIF14 isoform X2 [Molossus molossus]|uniref:kinesin-like protein KIF14 isoform X2 n=1 Tax=Molossus molossus TaxID=27622 RepID=UPI001745DBB9|nr:kinesin-like protein KIF14 isoform X2 [Molossus molossus]
MSVYTAHGRNSRDVSGAFSSPKSPSLSDLSHDSSLKLHLKSDMSERENDDPLLRSARKIRDINCTYVISACKAPGDTPLTPNPTGRLTLQRRVTRNKESSLLGSKVGESPEKVTETRLTLQRRARTGSVDKQTTTGTGSVDKWPTARTGSVDRWTTTGTGSVDKQTTAGTGSVDKRTTAGTDSVDRWTTAGTGSVDKRTTAGTGSVDKRTTTGTGSVDKRTTAGTGSVDKRTTAGTGSVDRWTTTGTGSLDKRTTSGTGSLDKRTTAGTDSVDRWTTAGTGSVDKRTTAGTGSVDRWTTTGTGSVDRRTTAGTGSVDKRTTAGTGSLDKRTTAGTGSLDKRTTTGTGSLDKRTTAGTGSVDKRTTAGTGSVDKRTTAATGSVDKQTATQNMGGTAESDCASPAASTNVKTVSNGENSLVASVPSAEDTKDADEKYKETFSALMGADDSVALQFLSHSTPVRPQGQTGAARLGQSVTRPLQSTLDIRVSGAGNLHHRSLGKDIAKNTNKLESLEKGTPTKCAAEHKWTPWCGPPQCKSLAASILKTRTPSFQVQQKPQSSLLVNKRERSQERTLPPQEEAADQSAGAERDPVRAESSQVTVAVRVRPFSQREKDENATQAVFLNGEEIAVRHPDLRHVYSFVYDVSFWSFDESHPHYASQATVYETLAAPLVARALEGYNTCLFAYGQTGSGKSYTMMGFGEEPGIIPRFCEDLFAQVAKKQTQEVRYHLEMSFFEVYNEKIHDLLVGKGERGQGKQPGWLQLGSKQRATAATCMNDQSSRSHSVLTLLMTRTQRESVAGEEHGHRVTSRINLVDLAGSERCGPAGSSGQQLREGVSINKSLLTLGKVISALAELGSRRRVFIPYRESVLTWLLKESLGGNSKTAMIATVSPAASSAEETLSTLRYARQARSIVNVARVNEDASAQLIRDLKAEIEKLKAAQRSHQNVDPERYRLCRQEITSLRMKLHQQERDMAEMQRVWKEKFEQAEKRKHHEIKELQKAGIAFQMDNCLPNLVNLSEDPQLSETLLYVLKEGATTVGRCGPSCSPDIRLSGVLVADHHCTIRNVDGTVSIIPVGGAKTYVNGRHVLEPTVLHHGDRVVLGGDHYFRFNHPAEIQKGRRPSGGDTLTSEGPRDFEFAKSELLVAQRSQLEAEIREAQLRAKQEMLQSVQIAQEVAERELSSQRAAYEGRIEALEAELKEESQRKKAQEMSTQRACRRVEELEEAKRRLEQEVRGARRRLQVESLAAQQALEDHSIRHTRILEALEAEKQKIAQEVQTLQQSQSRRGKAAPLPTSWGSMKLSLMIQEANAVSGRFQRQYVFGRHETSDGGGGSGPRVRVRNLQLGVSTLWSLEKFASKLAALKELYESNCSNKCEDLFCDPEDEWEPDVTDTPISSLSRRRSRSLVRSRRISGYLHDVQAHTARNPHSSCSSESSLPGICKDLIGSSLAALGPSREEKTMADSLMRSFLQVHSGLLAVSQAHEEQDEEDQDDLFSSDRAAQARAVQMACAFGQLTALVTHWLGDAPPSARSAQLGDELRQEVKKLGSHLQVFLQGCSSEIPSMVSDAQKKVVQVVRQAVMCVGQLAVLNGTRLHLLESGDMDAGVQEGIMAAVWDGVGSGLRMLLESGLETARALRHELLRQCPQDQVAQQLSAKAAALIGCLESIFAEWKTESPGPRGQPSGGGDLKSAADRAPDILELQRCLEQTVQMVVSILRGHRGDGSLLRSCVERVCSLARGIQVGSGVHAASAGGCDQSPGDLASIAKSLLLCFESEDGPDLLKPWETYNQSSREGPGPPGASGTGPRGSRGVPQRVYQLPSRPPRGSQERTPSRTRWV